MVQTAALAGSWLWGPINPAIAMPLDKPFVLIGASPASAAASLLVAPSSQHLVDQLEGDRFAQFS